MIEKKRVLCPMKYVGIRHLIINFIFYRSIINFFEPLMEFYNYRHLIWISKVFLENLRENVRERK